MTRNISRTFLGVMLLARALSAAELQITLDHPPSTGSVVFLLFDSPNTFGDLRDPFMTVTAPLDGRDVYVITNIPPQEYALIAFHDENQNAFIDRNFIGIPREPTGFSNRYQPKGPPSYARAAFTLSEGQTQTFDIELNRPLGRRGRIGVGPGMIWRSSPYRSYDGSVYRFIPAITYTGDRLQWFGPRVQFGLIGSKHVRLAATGEYRIGPYEEDGSTYLDGMGDADDTFMGGLALQCDLPSGIELALSGSLDVLGTIGGHEAAVKIDKSFQLGLLRISPGIGLNWMDAEMAANDYGVPASKATPARPAYKPGAAMGLEGSLNLFLELSSDWLFVANTGVEWLDNTITDSPIVVDDHVFKGFVALNYVF